VTVDGRFGRRSQAGDGTIAGLRRVRSSIPRPSWITPLVPGSLWPCRKPPVTDRSSEPANDRSVTARSTPSAVRRVEPC
jgi:hypothetical protein